MPVHLGAQREWLGHNVMYGRIKICQQQVGQLKPRLVDDVVTLGSRPIRTRIVALTEIPSEGAPRKRLQQRRVGRDPDRNGALFPDHWPKRDDRGIRVNDDRIRRCLFQ